MRDFLNHAANTFQGASAGIRGNLEDFQRLQMEKRDEERKRREQEELAELERLQAIQAAMYNDAEMMIYDLENDDPGSALGLAINALQTGQQVPGFDNQNYQILAQLLEKNIVEGNDKAKNEALKFLKRLQFQGRQYGYLKAPEKETLINVDKDNRLYSQEQGKVVLGAVPEKTEYENATITDGEGNTRSVLQDKTGNFYELDKTPIEPLEGDRINVSAGQAASKREIIQVTPADKSKKPFTGYRDGQGNVWDVAQNPIQLSPGDRINLPAAQAENNDLEIIQVQPADPSQSPYTAYRNKKGETFDLNLNQIQLSQGDRINVSDDENLTQFEQLKEAIRKEFPDMPETEVNQRAFTQLHTDPLGNQIKYNRITGETEVIGSNSQPAPLPSYNDFLDREELPLKHDFSKGTGPSAALTWLYNRSAGLLFGAENLTAEQMASKLKIFNNELVRLLANNPRYPVSEQERIRELAPQAYNPFQEKEVFDDKMREILIEILSRYEPDVLNVNRPDISTEDKKIMQRNILDSQRVLSKMLPEKEFKELMEKIHGQKYAPTVRLDDPELSELNRQIEANPGLIQNLSAKQLQDLQQYRASQRGQ